MPLREWGALASVILQLVWALGCVTDVLMALLSLEFVDSHCVQFPLTCRVMFFASLLASANLLVLLASKTKCSKMCVVLFYSAF